MTDQIGCRSPSRRWPIFIWTFIILTFVAITPGCTKDAVPQPTSRIIPPQETATTSVTPVGVTEAASPSPALPPAVEHTRFVPTETTVPSLCPPVEQGNSLTDVISGTIAVLDEDDRYYLLSTGYQEPDVILADLPCCTYDFYEETSPYQTEYLPLLHVLGEGTPGPEEETLYLVPAREEDALQIPWEADEWGNNFYGWFDEQTIILVPSGSPFGSMVLLNLFTGEQKFVSTTYTDLFDHFDYFRWNPSAAVYDPSLTRAVFLTRGPYSIVLVDLETDQELWRYTDPFSVNHEPVWLPNGEGFVVTKPVPLSPEYSWISYVSRDGVERLILEDPGYTGDPYGLFSMSPNGKFISFMWADESDPDISHLKILKLDDGTILDTCINLEKIAPYPYLWSPDSQKIIALTRDSTHLYDVEDGVVYQFERIGSMLVAWLSSEP